MRIIRSLQGLCLQNFGSLLPIPWNLRPGGEGSRLCASLLEVWRLLRTIQHIWPSAVCTSKIFPAWLLSVVAPGCGSKLDSRVCISSGGEVPEPPAGTGLGL